MGRYTLRHQLFRLPSLIILPITYGLIRLFKARPALTDSLYSSGIYPRLSGIIAGITRDLPFSLTEFILYALLIAAVVTLVIRILRLIFLRKDALIKLVSFIITIAITVSYGVFLFYLLWGFNFYRTPVDKRMDLPQREYGVEELYALCEKLADDAARLRAALPEDADGVLALSDRTELFNAVEETYNEYGETHELYKNHAPGIKEFGFSKILSNMRILGFYSCYTAEPNVNVDQPTLYLCHSAAHEAAHYYGWAREDEANFVSYLVCCRSGNKTVAYSVTMHALTNCARRLNEVSPSMAAELRTHYSEGMQRDLKAYRSFYNEYKDSEVGNISEQINDSYLTFNGQEDGINAYEDDVLLLLKYYDALGLFIGY